MTIQPFYVIPILIKQPTWGGNYIVSTKGLTQAQLRDERIGQSYELAAESRISTDPAAQDACYVTDSSMGSGQQFGSVATTIDLLSLISSNPEAVLGEALVDQLNIMPLLIKFTQARSNSYQVHVRPGAEFHGWQAKPESWYFLEPGKATLGVKSGSAIAQYKQLCLEIEAYSLELSRQVKNETMGIHEAREQLSRYLSQNNPQNYVNSVAIPPGAVVDLSQGGIHHSWEADASLPQGNIVYEVQVDVKDERSTMRSFDQGNLKDNGDSRPLHIEDYFQAVNASPQDNRPDMLIHQPQGTTEGNSKITTLFNTPYYTMKKYESFGANSMLMEPKSFHHIFALHGDVRVEWREMTFDLKEGRSLFIPAVCGTYVLSSSEATTALITSPDIPK